MRLIRYLLVFILSCIGMAVFGQNYTGEKTLNAADLPKVSPYFFQHQYLSVVAPMIEEADGEVFSDPKALNTISPSMNGFCSPFKDEDISVETVEADGKKIFVWKFPESEYLREALYLAFFPLDGHYKAFAICIGQLVDWEISCSTEKSRATYGRVKRPENAKECVELLVERGALTGEIKMGDLIQEGYKSLSYRE